MAQRKEEPDAERTLSVVQEFAGGVVDGRNVVSIEGVAHAQCVGQHSGPEAEDLCAVDVVVAAGRQGQQAPPDDVQAHDGHHHAGHPGPFGRAQCVPDTLQPPDVVGNCAGAFREGVLHGHREASRRWDLPGSSR